ncbi:MAG TPA: alpha/beta hydrolase domain-containing protein [Chloroflexota bacterium]|nr:alpha/beta hydrolase domain-containing protein [Chloroflexota bacterium]
MSVTRLELHGRTPFADGAAFGAAGPYERIDGTLHFAVDPADPANAAIVDLHRARRGADGRVHFRADLCVLQPADAARGCGQLLLEVPNRGRKGGLARFNRPTPPAGPASPPAEIAVGDGLLLNLGWTVAWIGWQWDVVRTLAPQGLVGFDAPQALGDDGHPIRGQVMLQWQLDTPAPHKLLADRVHRPYAAAGLDDPQAVLSRREWPGAPRSTIPRQRWRFARDEAGRPVPDDTHVWLEGGFRPGVIYELVYTTRVCPVVGAGLLALRDGTSFLRGAGAGAGNPCAGRLRYTLGFGSSQCGRLLRHFLYLGLNVDEAGRRVFDGLLINVAGARRGEFNHRYAQPSVITIPSFGYLPPLDFEGLLRTQRARGGLPRLVTTNTSSEYWNREASLLHTDDAGTRDVEPPDEVRVYHFAGTKHAPGALPPDLGADPPPSFGAGGQGPNVVDFKPLLRAALFTLERWVVRGTPPPPSVFPRLADATAAPPDEVLAAYGAIPGIAVPDPSRLYWRRPLDLGPRAARGVGRYPPQEYGRPYRWYVPAIDGDGNEVAGIRLPDVAAPVASHTGWFPRRPGTGGAGQNVDMMGSTIPFAPDPEGRRQRGDPRPSIAERYRDARDYETRVRAAAARLIADGYLLPEDLDLVVQNALARYRAFA